MGRLGRQVGQLKFLDQYVCSYLPTYLHESNVLDLLPHQTAIHTYYHMSTYQPTYIHESNVLNLLSHQTTIHGITNDKQIQKGDMIGRNDKLLQLQRGRMNTHTNLQRGQIGRQVRRWVGRQVDRQVVSAKGFKMSYCKPRLGRQGRQVGMVDRLRSQKET